jgi:predicted transcriptional regulator
MVVHLKPETESRLHELAAATGRAADELVEDAMAGYLAKLAQVRKMVDNRYDEIKSGRVEPIDGEDAFNRLRRKSENRRNSWANLSSTRMPTRTSRKFGNSLLRTI